MNTMFRPGDPDYDRLYQQWVHSGKPWYLDDYRSPAHYQVYRLDDGPPTFFLIGKDDDYTAAFRETSFNRR